MDQEQRSHLETLRQTHARRLRILEQQAALAGNFVRPEILIDIENTRLAIAEIEMQLEPAQPAAELAPEPRRPPKEQRKLSTILFADVSGFTALSEMLDPEDVAELMNALWQRIDVAITNHSGMIDKHIGDAVMAIWGAQATREDDPEQALRAALRMQEELAKFREERQLDLAMRIGVHTGTVLLGAVGTTGEFTAMGDAVNLASRLEHAAPVGGILISHDTYRQVRGLFVVQPLDPITVKGKAEPVRVYVVAAAKARAFRVRTRGIEGVETRMVGREAELKVLQEAFLTVVEDRQQQFVTIVAEPGLGKSRLLYEFDTWLELQPQEFLFFKGRAIPATQHRPYALLRDLFASRYQIQDSDPPAIVQAKLERAIGATFGSGADAQMKAHLLGHLLGFAIGDSPYLRVVGSDAQQVRDRAVAYLREYFLLLTAQRPVVLLLEDLHWADDSTLHLLAWLDVSAENSAFLIAGTARPLLLERQPRWGEGHAFHTIVRLQALGMRESRRLVAEILQRVENVPIELRDTIVASADGNPFYIEELVKMLIDDGVIRADADRWAIDLVRLGKIRVPATLMGVLQARFDSLSPPEQELLQRAAVLGRIFWDASVAYLGGAGVAELGDLLARLRSRELVFQREPSIFEDIGEYIFKHALLRDAVYDRVLKRERPGYHERAALWLAEITGRHGRSDEYAGLIAEHYAQAQKSNQASAWYQRAGAYAAARFANAEAVAHYTRALELTPASQTDARYDLLLARERLESLYGDRAAQAEDLASLAALAEQFGDDRRAEIALRQANYAEVTGDYPAAVAAARRAVDLARAAGAAESEAQAFFQWGRALFQQSDYAGARAALDQALELARAHGWAGVEANCLRNQGLVALNQGDYAQAISHGEQALELFRQLGDRRGERAALANLGAAAYFQADYPAAQALLGQALKISREIGDRQGESDTLGNMAAVAFDNGDYTRAQEQYEQALRLCQAIGNRWGEIDALSGCGKIASYRGDYAAAWEYHEQARQVCVAIGDPLGEGIALCSLGEVATHIGAHVTARDWLSQALKIFEQAGDRRNASWTLINLGLLLYQSGDTQAAQAAGEQAIELARDLGERSAQAGAHTVVGAALLSVGQARQAAEAYREALALRRGLNKMDPALDVLAGLSQALLLQGQIGEAYTCASELLAEHERSGGFGAATDPAAIYLACYRVLQARGDSRAQDMLAAGHRLLQERAARLADQVMRASYLELIPAHRQLVAAWNASAAAV